MNVGCKHTPYNYKFCNCSWTVLHYQKVHFFFKSTAQQNFLATGLNTAHILKYLDDIKLDMKKIRGIGTDGASTMLGCRNGVVAQLKRIRPSAIGIHCAAHRLDLASSQAGDAVSYVKKFNTIIRQLFDFMPTVRSAQLGWKRYKAFFKKNISKS